jgi:hypothetical protein
MALRSLPGGRRNHPQRAVVERHNPRAAAGRIQPVLAGRSRPAQGVEVAVNSRAAEGEPAAARLVGARPEAAVVVHKS